MSTFAVQHEVLVRLGAHLVEYRDTTVRVPNTLDTLTFRPASEAWFDDARVTGPDFHLGGTSCAAIQGVGYKTPWDVYSTALGFKERTRDNALLRRGRRWERIAREDYEEKTGAVTYAPLCRVAHADHPWLVPSPDAFALRDDELGLVEVKTASTDEAWGPDGTVIERWSEEAADLIPPGYAVQGYIGMAATGLPWCDFPVGTPDRQEFMTIRVVRLMADPATQDALVESARAWRERHLVQGIQPDPDDTEACGKALARRFPGDPTKLVVDATPEQAELIFEIAAVKAEAKDCEARQTALKNRLAVLFGDTYGVRLASGQKCLWVPMKGKTSVDSKRLAAEFPAAFAACSSQGAPHRQFNLYGFKE